MSPPQKEPLSPEFNPSQFKDAIKLQPYYNNELKEHRTAPPSYHSQMDESEGPRRRSSAARQLKSERRQTAAMFGGSPPSPTITQESILLSHIQTQRERRERRARQHVVDWALDVCITITQGLTVLFLLFMIVWTAYKWWSLGPEYAPVDAQGQRWMDGGGAG